MKIINYSTVWIGMGIAWFIMCPSLVFAAPAIQSHLAKQEQKATDTGLKKSVISAHVILSTAVVVQKGTDVLDVVGEDGSVYVVHTDQKTQWRRKFWGVSDISEVTVNDVLSIYGIWKDETGSHVQARLIRNNSIQKRYGVFFGTVKSMTSNGWLIETKQRGDQTVTVSTSTVYTDRNQNRIAQDAVLVGHRIRVKGLWDAKASTISEVSHVKDFTLPIQTSPKL